MRALISLLLAGIAFGQTFDLADVHPSVREINPTPVTTGGVLRSGHYELRQATMLDLIAKAYGVDSEIVWGGPNWLQMDRFDVIAVAPASTPAPTVKIMLRHLLEDRFHLAVRNEMRPLPAFALLAANSKPKLKASDDSGDGECQSKRESGTAPVILVSCRNTTMENFAQNLREISAPWINKPVVDRSALKGAWDFDFRFTPWSATAAQARGDGITIFDALEKQLGLKLELQKAPAPVLLIDHVNRAATGNPPDVTRRLGASPLTEFEVAVIKPSAPDTSEDLELRPGGEVAIKGLTLHTLIALAWHLDPDTNDWIAGAPKFLDSARFDITARPPAGNGPQNAAPLDVDELRVLLQALLKDRFRLAAHIEDRAVTGYTLVAVKPKMKRADPANPTRWKEGPGPDGKDQRITNPILSRLVSFQNITMAQFAEVIPLIASGSYFGPVLDSTGLGGSFDFTLSFSSAGLVRAAGSDGEPNGALSIFDAIERQLGLKLAKARRPLPVLVIDHIEEKPTEN